MRRNLSEMYIAALECIRAHPTIIQYRIMQKTGLNCTALIRILEYLEYRKLIQKTDLQLLKRGLRYKDSKRNKYIITDAGRNVLKLNTDLTRALNGNVEASTNSQPSPFSANSERVVNPSPLRGD